MKGCWFWDEYNPACSVPLGATGAEAGPAEGGADAGTPEAGDSGDDGAGDGAAPPPCLYPNVEPVLSYDSTVGDPNPGGDQGSMKVEIPFSAYNQQSLVQWIFATPQDFSNKTLFVRVRLDSGFNTNPSAPGAFEIAVKTGNMCPAGPCFVYGASPYTGGQLPVPAPATPSFLEVDFDLHSTPAGANAGFDATQVVAIELHFDTGGGPVGTDGGSGRPPAPAVFHIDTIALQ
jgi:hypothetical protein